MNSQEQNRPTLPTFVSVLNNLAGGYILPTGHSCRNVNSWKLVENAIEKRKGSPHPTLTEIIIRRDCSMQHRFYAHQSLSVLVSLYGIDTDYNGSQETAYADIDDVRYDTVNSN